jgi:hypothetical protein
MDLIHVNIRHEASTIGDGLVIIAIVAVGFLLLITRSSIKHAFNPFPATSRVSPNLATTFIWPSMPITLEHFIYKLPPSITHLVINFLVRHQTDGLPYGQPNWPHQKTTGYISDKYCFLPFVPLGAGYLVQQQVPPIVAGEQRGGRQTTPYH